MKRILITLNDQGGAFMEWNYRELASTLRATMASHQPVIVEESYEERRSTTKGGTDSSGYDPEESRR